MGHRLRHHAGASSVRFDGVYPDLPTDPPTTHLGGPVVDLQAEGCGHVSEAVVRVPGVGLLPDVLDVAQALLGPGGVGG